MKYITHIVDCEWLFNTSYLCAHSSHIKHEIRIMSTLLKKKIFYVVSSYQFWPLRLPVVNTRITCIWSYRGAVVLFIYLMWPTEHQILYYGFTPNVKISLWQNTFSRTPSPFYRLFGRVSWPRCTRTYVVPHIPHSVKAPYAPPPPPPCRTLLFRFRRRRQEIKSSTRRRIKYRQVKGLASGGQRKARVALIFRYYVWLRSGMRACGIPSALYMSTRVYRIFSFLFIFPIPERYYVFSLCLFAIFLCRPRARCREDFPGSWSYVRAWRGGRGVNTRGEAQCTRQRQELLLVYTLTFI